MRGKRYLGVAAALVGMAFGATAAQADHHDMLIREVFPNPSGDGAFIELQMYSPRQNLVGGHTVKTYDAAGAETLSHTFVSDVVNGENNRTILLADTALTNADATNPALGGAINPLGGAVCFLTVPASNTDCVTWGPFAGFAGTAPDAVSNPISPTQGLLGGHAIERLDSRGCPSFLDRADDTDDSAADFTQDPFPSPQSNAEPVVGEACIPPRITIRGPRATRDRTPKFRISANEDGVAFRCKVDSRALRNCEDPHTTRRLKPGKHKLTVRGTGQDGLTGQASKRFTIKK